MSRHSAAAVPVAGASFQPGPPRANLLPKEYYNSIKERKILRLMWLLVIGVLLIGVAGTAGAAYAAQQAKSELTAEQERGAKLRAERAQYSELTEVLGELDTARAAQAIALYAEADWQKLSGEFDKAMTATEAQLISLNLGQRLAPRVSSGGFSDTSEANPLSQLTPVFVEYQVESAKADAGDKLLDKLADEITGFEWAAQTSAKRGSGGEYTFAGVIRLGMPAIGTARAEAVDETLLADMRDSFEQASADRDASALGN